MLMLGKNVMIYSNVALTKNLLLFSSKKIFFSFDPRTTNIENLVSDKFLLDFLVDKNHVLLIVRAYIRLVISQSTTIFITALLLPITFTSRSILAPPITFLSSIISSLTLPLPIILNRYITYSQSWFNHIALNISFATFSS